MADPILADHWRVQVVFQGNSLLPEDRYTNSFVFRNDGDVSTPPFDQRAADVMQDFYTGLATGQLNELSDFINLGAIESAAIKCYDLGQAPPRTPVERPLDVAVPTTAATPWPGEVAAVLSLRTALRTGRGRGRIFLGPLKSNAAEIGADGIARVHVNFRDAVKAAADRLRADNGGFMTWRILSQADGVARDVIGGYVDNAFDTMRSRGATPTLRTTFGTVI